MAGLVVPVSAGATPILSRKATETGGQRRSRPKSRGPNRDAAGWALPCALRAACGTKTARKQPWTVSGSPFHGSQVGTEEVPRAGRGITVPISHKTPTAAPATDPRGRRWGWLICFSSCDNIKIVVGKTPTTTTHRICGPPRLRWTTNHPDGGLGHKKRRWDCSLPASFLILALLRGVPAGVWPGLGRSIPLRWLDFPAEPPSEPVAPPRCVPQRSPIRAN